MKPFKILLLLVFITFIIHSGCNDEGEPVLQTVDVAFNLEVTVDSVAADGRSLAEFVATLSGSNTSYKPDIVVFETQNGVFSNNETIDSVRFNEFDSAMAYMSHDQASSFIVTASIGSQSNSSKITFVDPALHFSFSITDDQPADGKALAELSVTFDSSNTLLMPKKVIFETQKGLFTNGKMLDTVAFEIDSTARTFLSYDTPETFLVTSNIDGFIKSEPVTFISAFAEMMVINLSVATITNQPGQQVSITANLLRDVGQVNSGFTVNWTDSTSGGTSPGIFLNTAISNSDSQAFTEYHLQDTTYTGDIFFIGTVQSESAIVSGKSKVFVLDE